MLSKDDALEMAPNVHKLLFENEKVRVLGIMIKPNEVAKMHWHPENISYILASGKLKITKPEGTISEVELKAGQITSAKAGSHEIENIGDTDVSTIQIEFKF